MSIVQFNYSLKFIYTSLNSFHCCVIWWCEYW